MHGDYDGLKGRELAQIEPKQDKNLFVHGASILVPLLFLAATIILYGATFKDYMVISVCWNMEANILLVPNIGSMLQL